VLLIEADIHLASFRVNISLGMVSGATAAACHGHGLTGSLDAAQGQPVAAAVSILHSGMLFEKWGSMLAFPHQANR
jgi:hypothetical protein